MDSDSEDDDEDVHHMHDAEDGTDGEEPVPKQKPKLERVSQGLAMGRSSMDDGAREGGTRPNLERWSQGSRKSVDTCLGKRTACGDDVAAACSSLDEEAEQKEVRT